MRKAQRKITLLLFALALCAFAKTSLAETEKESPWLIMPTLSANPKLGTSLGVLGGYLHKFDAQSRTSLFAIAAQHSTTDSNVAYAFARTSFLKDTHRINMGIAYGAVKNDYDDYLGTGQPLKTNDDMHLLALRYLYRYHEDWFIGAQAILTDYAVVGDSLLDQQFLNIVGLTGYKSGALGFLIYHDSRDNDNSPTSGWVLNANNLAYREAIAGEDDFDVYRLNYKQYWEHSQGKVFTVNQTNIWTVDAPPSAYAPISLRGYKRGQYLGKNMFSAEAEERVKINQKWGFNVFAGFACLYGDGKSCSESENQFLNIGAGIQYLIKPKEGIVASLEFATGKDDNQGAYLKMAYNW